MVGKWDTAWLFFYCEYSSLAPQQTSHMAWTLFFYLFFAKSFLVPICGVWSMRVKQVYRGTWVYLIKDKWLPCVSKLAWLAKCTVNSIFWNKSLFTCCLLLLKLNTELFVFPSSLPLLEEGKQSLDGTRAS